MPAGFGSLDTVAVVSDDCGPQVSEDDLQRPKETELRLETYWVGSLMAYGVPNHSKGGHRDRAAADQGASL